MFKEKSVILFQGDSITDCGRNREDFNCLGGGYPLKIKKFFSAFYSDKEYTVLNRGVSGDTTAMMLDRWETDATALKPDVLSLLAGINDTWRRYDSNRATTAKQFEQNYRSILEKSLSANPQLTVILIEPFLIDANPAKLNWREEDLNEKQYIVSRLAREYNTRLLSAESLYRQKSIEKEPSYWAADGVHPTDAGHSLLALEWLKVAGFLK